MTTTTPPTTTNEKGKKQKKENLWNDLKHAVEGFLKESQLNDTCVKTPQALRFARLAWNAFFVTMLIVCGIMLTLSCIDFASNGKITTMVEVDRAPDHFPAVSVCNLDPFATSDPLLQTTLSQQFNLIGGSLVSVSSEENTLGLDVESGWQLMKRYVLGLSASEKNKLGIDSSSGDLVNSTSIVSCVFDGELCSPDSVSFYNDFEYGNCFRFNANTSNVEEVSKRGARGGLQLVMYTGPANASVTRSRGFRLVVHSPSETYVNLDDEGVNAAPGLLTSVAVERNLYSRLPKPFSNCVADSLAEWPTRSRTMDLMLNELNMTVYSQRVCLEIDYQQALKAECGCIDPFAVRLFTMADVDDLCIEPVDMLCSRAFFANYYSRNSDVDQCPASKLTVVMNADEQAVVFT